MLSQEEADVNFRFIFSSYFSFFGIFYNYHAAFFVWQPPPLLPEENTNHYSLPLHYITKNRITRQTYKIVNMTLFLEVFGGSI